MLIPPASICWLTHSFFSAVPTFTRVAQELRSQYLLAFAPETLDGKVHKLEVRVKRPGVTVRARKSYSAIADTPTTPRP